jgi:hypothetical protein
MNHMMIDYVVKLHLHKYLIFIGSCVFDFAFHKAIYHEEFFES